MLPDLGEELARVDHYTTVTPQEKLKAREEVVPALRRRRASCCTASSALLKAFSLFEKDVDYVVQEGKVIIVDEFTGRLMPGRRYSDGLHQALEAKENVNVQGETQTLRHDHAAELLPDVREAGRDDRHGDDDCG